MENKPFYPQIQECGPPAPALQGHKYKPLPAQIYRSRSPFSLRPTNLDPSPFLSPQKAVVARRLRSKGGAHLLQIPWQAGYVTP